MFTWISLIFSLYLGAFLVLVALLPLRIRKYYPFSWKTHWISNMERKASNVSRVFIAAMTLLVFNGILFLFSLAKIVPINPQTLAFYGGCLLTLTSLPATAVFRPDENLKGHLVFAMVLFIGILVTFAGTIILIVSGILKNNYLVFSLLPIFFCLLFMYSQYGLSRKHNLLELTDLIEIRPNEPSFIIRNTTVWEWCILFTTVIGLIAFAMFVR